MDARTVEHPGEALAKFDAMMLDDRHRTLTRMAFDWSLQRAVDPDYAEHAKQAFLASTFGAFCEPSSATLEESFHSLKFLLIIFKTDDASPAVMDEFIPLLDETRGVAPASPPTEIEACYRDLVAYFCGMGRDPTAFLEALRSLCVSMQIENRADKARMTDEEFTRIRKDTIALRAYAECWRTIRGLSFPPGLDEVLHSSAIVDIASEVAYLANDIGSFDKDLEVARINPERVDLNFVLRRMRAHGDRDAALRSAITLHNERTADYQRAESALLSGEHGAAPALRAYLEIIRCTVKGNLATTKHLGPFRYRGAADPLSHLVML